MFLQGHAFRVSQQMSGRYIAILAGVGDSSSFTGSFKTSYQFHYY